MHLNFIVSLAREVSILSGRGKELEENGFGVVLDKKGRSPYELRPGN